MPIINSCWMKRCGTLQQSTHTGTYFATSGYHLEWVLPLVYFRALLITSGYPLCVCLPWWHISNRYIRGTPSWNIGQGTSHPEEAGFTLKSEKCTFLDDSVDYLGVVKTGVHPQDKKVTVKKGTVALFPRASYALQSVQKSFSCSVKALVRIIQEGPALV